MTQALWLIFNLKALSLLFFSVWLFFSVKKSRSDNFPLFRLPCNDKRNYCCKNELKFHFSKRQSLTQRLGLFFHFTSFVMLELIKNERDSIQVKSISSCEEYKEKFTEEWYMNGKKRKFVYSTRHHSTTLTFALLQAPADEHKWVFFVHKIIITLLHSRTLLCNRHGNNPNWAFLLFFILITFQTLVYSTVLSFLAVVFLFFLSLLQLNVYTMFLFYFLFHFDTKMKVVARKLSIIRLGGMRLKWFVINEQ